MKTLNILYSLHRLYVIALAVALHLGADTSEHAPDHRQYVVVLDFIEQAVNDRIGYETQVIADMDRLDRELA